MKGKLVEYIEVHTEWNKINYRAIVIDYRDGYNIRKSWSNKNKFIECPMVKVFWICEPHIKPTSALRRMSVDWNMDPQYSFGFAENKNNYIIDEWDNFKSEWYYLDIFKVVD